MQIANCQFDVIIFPRELQQVTVGLGIYIFILFGKKPITVRMDGSEQDVRQFTGFEWNDWAQVPTNRVQGVWVPIALHDLNMTMRRHEMRCDNMRIFHIRKVPKDVRDCAMRIKKNRSPPPFIIFKRLAPTINVSV